MPHSNGRRWKKSEDAQGGRKSVIMAQEDNIVVLILWISPSVFRYVFVRLCASLYSFLDAALKRKKSENAQSSRLSDEAGDKEAGNAVVKAQEDMAKAKEKVEAEAKKLKELSDKATQAIAEAQRDAGRRIKERITI